MTDREKSLYARMSATERESIDALSEPLRGPAIELWWSARERTVRRHGSNSLTPRRECIDPTKFS